MIEIIMNDINSILGPECAKIF